MQPIFVAVFGATLPKSVTFHFPLFFWCYFTFFSHGHFFGHLFLSIFEKIFPFYSKSLKKSIL